MEHLRHQPTSPTKACLLTAQAQLSHRHLGYSLPVLLRANNNSKNNSNSNSNGNSNSNSSSNSSTLLLCILPSETVQQFMGCARFEQFAGCLFGLVIQVRSLRRWIYISLCGKVAQGTRFAIFVVRSTLEPIILWRTRSGRSWSMHPGKIW